MSSPVQAQRTAENAVTSSEDAFGHSVGMERAGIYSDQDTRGFSPLKAGNARIDGIYYDPVSVMSHRFIEGSSVRVGFAAESFPFQAPTGIVDYRLRPFSNDAGITPAFHVRPYGGWLFEFDARVPVIKDKLVITAGGGIAHQPNYDRSYNDIHGLAVRPILRLGATEVSVFYGMTPYTAVYQHPLVIAKGQVLPKLTGGRPEMLQHWARGKSRQLQWGGTVKTALSSHLAIRAGVFHSEIQALRSFTEMYTMSDHSGTARHKVIADPRHDTASDSGEALLLLRFGDGSVQHQFFTGYRARDRRTETGGADSRDFGTVDLGEVDQQPRPDFTFSAINVGRVRQSSLLLGYSVHKEGLGSVNLGVQKARYRARSQVGTTGASSLSRDDPWLYNAALRLDLARNVSMYMATQRGLEDSGLAPETASNRNAQLPAARTTQYEAGLRWKFGKSQLVVSAFQIKKPFFTFDAAQNYVANGDVRHRGVEASLSGQFGERFSLLAGALVMQPRVLGAARAQASRPAGAPSLFARIDANYRTDLLDGLTPTLAAVYVGRRAGTLRDATGHQLMIPDHMVFDLGLRQKFLIGKVPASFKVTMQNVFDHANWVVAGPSVLTVDERRRFNANLTMDF